MACDAEDCGFQMLNDDDILTSVQKESDPVDYEMDEDEDNNNEIERRSSESIGTGHLADNRKPNAIPAVYGTGHYTDIENHHMRETCLKEKQNRCKM
ncbi:UNVERIFIED_CONTAM: hypothetical protein NCL1_53849 [Trichonephila clavipes]